MSAVHVAPYNQNQYSSKRKNGHISSSNYTEHTSKYVSPTHHKNGYLTTHQQSEPLNTYTTPDSPMDADSDTLEDMESQSPQHSPTHYPRTYKPNTNTKSINNHSVRHRFPIKKATNNSNMSIRNRYYTRYGFKKFTSNNRKYNKYTMPNKNKKDYTYKIIAGISLFLIAISIYYFYGDLLTFTALKENHHSIIQFIDKYPIFSPIVFILFECVVVGLTIPGATVLSMAAGLFFRQPFASLYAWCGCGLGAFLCFLSVRYICADCFRSMLTRHGEWFNTFKKGLRKNELLYLIYVRYVIIIPFWFVNVAAALFQCKIYNFILSTFIATIPGALLLTTAGRGLANAFETYNSEITLLSLVKEILWSKDMLFCLLLLLFCLSIPFLLKKYGGKQFDIFNDSESNIDSKNYKSNGKFSKYRDNDFFDSDNDSDDKNK